MSFKEDFGKRLKYWRENRGMTTDDLRDLAGLTGRAKATIIKEFEWGTELPAYKDIETLAKSLGIAPQVLMGGTRKVILLDCYYDADRFAEIFNRKEVDRVIVYKEEAMMVIYWDYDEGEEDD
ncbi:MAG: helix-turn-helix domain-containing protein [Bacilli bacterium]|nr:helix-turn-helix domain-containing protein [Bacilli bacterium]